MKKEKTTSDFSERYHAEAIAIIKQFFCDYPHEKLEGSWGPWGKYYFLKKDNNQGFFYINSDWLQRTTHDCYVIADIDSKEFCDDIRHLTEWNQWNEYIGAGQPGWSLRWLDAIKSADKNTRQRIAAR